MGDNTNKSLVPFANAKPLVPGSKGGRPAHWQQERKNQALKNEILDMAKVVRRLSQELIEQILFIRDPNPKSPEEKRRAMSRMLGALKQDSAMLSNLFEISDIHPALTKMFLNQSAEPVNEPGQEPNFDIELLPLPTVPALASANPTIFHLLTDRELEFVTYLLAGYTIPKAAAKMGITEGTAHNHRHNILGKARDILGEKGETDE